MLGERSASRVTVVSCAPHRPKRPLPEYKSRSAVASDQSRRRHTPTLLKEVRVEGLLVRKVFTARRAMPFCEAGPGTVAVGAVASSRL